MSVVFLFKFFLIFYLDSKWKRRAQRRKVFGRHKIALEAQYPNFLLSHFPPLAQRPRIFNSGEHSVFPVASCSDFYESVWMSSSSHCRKQRHKRNKKKSRFSGSTGVVSERGEASSPVAVPASGKKLAQTRPSSSTGEPSHGACSSDSHTDFLCEMKGLRLIDPESLLASLSRRACCSVCGSPLTVREDLKLRKGICNRLTLSCTNSLCAGSDDLL